MTLGVTIGKFYPFHVGHHHLITEAKSRVDHMAVLSCARDDQEIPGAIRAGWIREMHPDVTVYEVVDDLPEAPEPWARRTVEVLGRAPDLVFTSEGYGAEYAALMGARHVAVDQSRSRFPISGRDLRADLAAHWGMLTPPAKAYLARRVAVVGAESSGTTTLAQALAVRYQTVWVPEYGRWYWEGRQHTPEAAVWSTDEFVRIATRQGGIEDDLARLANRLVVCDTDALATHVWHRRFVGHYSEAVDAIVDGRRYDLYIVTLPDFPFVQDGTREGEHIRDEMHSWFVEVLTAKGRPHIVVGGSRGERLDMAASAIDPLLRWEPLR
jgi:HTH-type transcriptional regulator, transcriptional repressor of NAD biosynthesis genes